MPGRAGRSICAEELRAKYCVLSTEYTEHRFCLMYSLARHGAAIGRQQKNLFPARSGSGDHALAEAKLYLPRGQVGYAHHQPADQITWLVRFLDAGKDRFGRAAA